MIPGDYQKYVLKLSFIQSDTEMKNSGQLSVQLSCGRSWVHAPVSQDGLVVRVSNSHVVGCGFMPGVSGWLSG